MKTLSREFSDALKTMTDMQRQGRMSHAERIVIERAITERYVHEFDPQTQGVLERQIGGLTRPHPVD